MDLGIVGKRVLITGASQGIGYAIAKDFAREGCRAAVIARRKEKLQALVEQIGGREKGHAYYAGDLMREGIPERAVEALKADGEDFDIVVHNIGGTLEVRDPLAPWEEWFRVWRFNAGVAIEINRLLIPAMQEKGWGRVIHISSLAGEQLRGCGPYGAAKAYLNAYTKVLGRAVAPSGVVVSAIMPGSILAEGGHWDKVQKNDPAKLADYLRHHQATGRLGTPEEISCFALFLASKYATFAQGAVVPVDGGTM